MLSKFFKSSVIFSFFLAMAPALTAQTVGVELSQTTSCKLFPLVKTWGEATSPGHFDFQVYGCSRPNLAAAHAECDTAIGVVKGGEADVFFTAIEEGLSSENLGNVTIVPASLISCDSDSAPRCSVKLHNPFGRGDVSED